MTHLFFEISGWRWRVSEDTQIYRPHIGCERPVISENIAKYRFAKSLKFKVQNSKLEWRRAIRDYKQGVAVSKNKNEERTQAFRSGLIGMFYQAIGGPRLCLCLCLCVLAAPEGRNMIAQGKALAASKRSEDGSKRDALGYRAK